MLKLFASGLDSLEVSLHIVTSLDEGSLTPTTKKTRKKHKRIEPENNFYFTKNNPHFRLSVSFSHNIQNKKKVTTITKIIRKKNKRIWNESLLYILISFP
jgi:DNA-binding transcriptional MocR family regulator